ncbi:hypothetical protein Salat_1055800 [Sesamum alatum]|uniref:Uncharacterized protein n=1 Tax=Sesamum alatum TaxID=300844 RepID=A0AAE2CSI1_9LAMI|nr:hypothetical protein Salat_1055800 [Sesamum alatum]
MDKNKKSWGHNGIFQTWTKTKKAKSMRGNVDTNLCISLAQCWAVLNCSEPSKKQVNEPLFGIRPYIHICAVSKLPIARHPTPSDQNPLNPVQENSLMFVLQPCAPVFHTLHTSISGQSNKYTPFLDAGPPLRARCSSRLYSHVTRVRSKNKQSQMEMNGFDASGGEEMEDEDDVSWRGGGFGGREGEEKDYDRDPEFAEILGSCLDDPDKARAKMEERLRKKRNKILHTKTGSPDPMQVKFNKFDFTNSYIWLEFYNAPLEKDVSLICDTIRSWHIVGRLGGCNSMNMQLSQSPLEQRPTYDAIQGANVTPTTFYNIGDLEIQDNLARIWVDIGTSEPLILDILINALTQISSDYVGIKQVMFGGSEFENWRENLKTEDTGYSVHKI